VYRWDFLSFVLLCLAVFLFVRPLWSTGYIVFSDLDFGLSSRRYLNEIYGVWNERWSTPTLLNIARLPWILVPWLISGLFGWSGAVFLKTFVTLLLLVAAGSMYWLCKRITSIYFSRHFDAITIFAMNGGALYYALNPWVVFRIQHVFLLCGYSLMPLCLLFFFNAFDPRFQRQFIAGFEPSRVRLYRRQVFDLSCFALFYSISAGAIHYFFYGIFFYGGIGTLLLLNALRLEKGGLKARWGVVMATVLKLCVLNLIFGFFSAFWLGSYVGSILKHAEVSQHNVNVVDTLSLFSRNSSPVNVLYLISYWWPMFDLHALPITFWLGGGVLLGVIVFCVLVRGWRHPILLLFSVLCIFFALMGTGVQLEAFAGTFVKVVTKTPVIGPIFRDPNKAVGLMAIGFSILISFGTQILVRWLAPPRGKRWMQGAAVCAILTGLWFYVTPVRRPFIDGFYRPETLPPEYFRIQNELTDPDKFDSRVLYLPVADDMVQPETGIATPFWNINPYPGGMVKATGDYQVYSSSKNTLFQHEGNSPNIDYYFSFLQDLMDTGASERIGRLLGPLGVNELAYHDEYLGQEKRQRFNLDVLGLQSDVHPRVHDGLWTLFNFDGVLPYMSVVPRRIFTPYGLTSLEGYGAFPNFNFRDNGVVFSGWEKGGGLDVAQPGDILDVRQLNDLALTALPDADYLVPFDSVEDGDPFLKWSKTLLNNSDWFWALQSQDLRGFAYDTDLNAGVVLTFASRRLDLRPYQMEKAERSAPVVTNLDQMLANDKEFVADAPEKVSVQTYPGGPYNNLPLIHGEVSRGEPNHVWQVAKSGYLDAQANTPYEFRVLASGRGTNHLHIKARFFDANHKEIGVQYVVAPNESIDFDAVNLFGECISPPDTRYVRLDLLTLPRKETKVYWWVHDVEIKSLAKWAVPNVIHCSRKFKSATQTHVFARLLLSAKGGVLRFGFGGTIRDVATADPTLTQFVWRDLGLITFPAGETPVTIENLGGFNAVNILAIVPLPDLAAARSKVQGIATRARIVSVMQAETDFQRDGPIQSDRVYPELAMGRGYAAETATLSRPIEIIKPDHYTLGMWLATGAGGGGVRITLTGADGRLVRQIDWQAPTVTPQDNWVVESDPFDEKFPRSLARLPGLLAGYRRYDVPMGELGTGQYTLALQLDSKVPSMAGLSSLRPFDRREIVIPTAAPPEPDNTCAACVSVTKGMMRDSYRGGVFRMDCDPTCSCDWYANSTNMLPAEGETEYLISFSARSSGVQKRHTKVFCLDAGHRPLDTVYINEVDASEQGHWNPYQQIIRTPPGTKWLQFHVWARGGMSGPGSVEIQNFSLLPIKKLLMVDQVALVEGERLDDLFATPPAPPRVTFSRVDTMKRAFQVGGAPGVPKLIRFAESPSPLWELCLGGKSVRSAVAINGVSNAFLTSDTGNGVVETVLRTLYLGGLLLFASGFGVVWLLWKAAVPNDPPGD